MLASTASSVSRKPGSDVKNDHCGLQGIYYGTSLIFGFIVGLRLLSFSFEDSTSGTINLRSAFQGQLHLLAESDNSVADPGKYTPLVRHKVLEKARRKTTTVEDPNAGIFYGKQIERDPKFWISLHNENFDRTRWSIYTYGDYYEKALSNAFVDVLQKLLLDLACWMLEATLVSFRSCRQPMDQLLWIPLSRIPKISSACANHSC